MHPLQSPADMRRSIVGPSEILQRRLRNQHLVDQRSHDPREVIAHLGAVQSQDFPGALWALAQRVTGASLDSLRSAFNRADFLRTHVLRPTWHFVAAEDIRWMLALTGPRIRRAMASRERELGMDPTLVSRAFDAIGRALQGGRALTRSQLGLAFAEAGVDVAVIEVGLGGRLDATNIIHPELAIITNIAFDHAEYLGNTLTAIAGEKAGIVKPGVALLTAEEKPDILALFATRAREMSAPLHALAPLGPDQVEFDVRGTSLTTSWHHEPVTFRTPLIGRHQGINAAVAIRGAELLDLDIGPDDIQNALDLIRWPGRLQVERVGNQTWVFDVAHNVAGVQALVSAIGHLDLPRPLVLVLGILGDKDWRAMLPPLFELADESILTIPPTAPPNRTWNPQLALDVAGEERARVIADFGAALELAHGAAGNGTVLVTGSFHTVGDALISLNRTPFGSDVTLPRASFAG